MPPRPANPIGDGAVNDGHPKLFRGIALILKDKLLQRSLLLRLRAITLCHHVGDKGRTAQWFHGAICGGTAGLVLPANGQQHGLAGAISTVIGQ